MSIAIDVQLIFSFLGGVVKAYLVTPTFSASSAVCMRWMIDPQKRRLVIVVTDIYKVKVVCPKLVALLSR